MATRPRRILPGTSWFVTRRCSERRLFLRPSRALNAILLYVLAAKAERYGVRVHACCALSNHLHLVITDVRGRLPDFVRDFDSLVARAVNASLGRFEGFWASETSYSAVEPLAPADVVAKIAYVLANPVAAGLVNTQVYTRVSITRLKAVHTATHPAATLEGREPGPRPREGPTPRRVAMGRVGPGS